MIDIVKVSEFYSVVLLGSFNPMIYHPYWLKDKGIIGEEDITKEAILVHEEVSSFKVGDWMQMVINKNRCEFKTPNADKIIIMRDIIIGCLNALPETPIIAFGINRGWIAQLSSNEAYYELGAKLTPLDLWKDNFENPRLRNIAIEDTDNKNFAGTKRLIIIQPASAELELSNAIDINLNNHFDMPGDKQKPSYAMKIIEENLIKCYDSFDNIVSKMISKL